MLLKYIRPSQEQSMILEEEQTDELILRFWLAYKAMSFTEAGNKSEQWGGLGKGKVCILDMLTLR